MSNPLERGSEILAFSTREAWAEVNCLLLVHDEFEREGLRGLLSNRGMKSIRSMSNFETTLRTVSRLEPNLIIAVVGDPPDFPIRLLAPIREAALSVGIVVLCDPVWVPEYLPVVTSISDIEPAGIKLLLRNTLQNGDCLRIVIDQVLDGRQSIERDVIDLLLQNRGKRSIPLAKVLTNRELQVLELVSAGYTNAKIAAQLEMSSAGVANIVTHVFAKMGLRDLPDINSRVKASCEFLAEYG